MKFNADIHNRKSLRLKDYDYSQNGLYFITIAVQNKLCLLGEINDCELHLFESGEMIIKEWIELENKYENIVLHDFVVMPNHFHGIMEIVDDENNDYYLSGTHKGHPYSKKCDVANVGAIPCGCPNNDIKKKVILGDIIGGFKSKTTNKYIKNVENNNWLPFNKKLWQRNYYEHIIRNEESYIKICKYIQNNPKNWDEDKFYFNEV